LHIFHALAVSTSLAFVAAGAQSQDANALVNEARKLSREGQQAAALARYREALAIDAGSFDAHYGAGIALDLEGDYAEARAQFNQAIELAAADTKIQALTGLAVSYVFDRRPADAARVYQQIFDSQMSGSALAGAAETANALGRVYLESGDLANAIKWYQTGYETARRQRDLSASELDLADLRWAHAQARIAARRGRNAEARMHLAAVKMLIDKGTNPEQAIQYPYAAGYVAFYTKDYAAAVSELEHADQDDPFILVLLGQAQEKLGHRAEAIARYRQVEMLNGHSINNAFARPLARERLAAIGQKTE
jgi:tetratricopeptide (TPR) repeat protein